MNAALVDAFAHACRARGAPADAVAVALARLSAAEAPGASAREFLPVCGLYALGARASVDEGVRSRFVAELHAHADDTRFRVREAVVQSLARVGSAAGESLLPDLSPWLDGYFHAAAVVHALASGVWLARLHDAAAVVACFDQAYALAGSAPRAAARWPGHKELVVALERAIPALAVRFGVPIFDMLVRWGATQDPALRELVVARASLAEARGSLWPGARTGSPGPRRHAAASTQP